LEGVAQSDNYVGEEDFVLFYIADYVDHDIGLCLVEDEVVV
jgi:hypothetical protein